MPAPRKYPLELMERGARMVLQMRTETGCMSCAVARVAACTAGSCIDFPRAERYELSAATADVINERRRVGGASWSAGPRLCGPWRPSPTTPACSGRNRASRS